MIDLTPLDVRKKKEDFRKAMWGYDASQVNSFLDLVADRFEELVGEHRSLSERVESLREQLGHYQERERALNEALLAAQELREEARSQAERDAAVKLREAEAHAEAILLEADQALRHSQRRLKEVRARRVQFIRSVRGVLQRFSEGLELEEARLEAEPDDFGDLLEKLQQDAPSMADAGPRGAGGESAGGDRKGERSNAASVPEGESPEPENLEAKSPEARSPEPKRPEPEGPEPPEEPGEGASVASPSRTEGEGP